MYSSWNNKPRFYQDSRNRSSIAMYEKLGGQPTSEDVGLGMIRKIDWKRLNLLKIRKDFYKVEAKKIRCVLLNKFFFI